MLVAFRIEFCIFWSLLEVADVCFTLVEVVIRPPDPDEDDVSLGDMVREDGGVEPRDDGVEAETDELNRLALDLSFESE